MTAHTISADRLWDGSGSPALVCPIVRVSDGKIETVERGLLPGPSCSGERIDFPGCTILPGLIDTHVHLVFSALNSNQAIIEQVTRETDDELYERARNNAQAALRAGLTTLRDCGGKGAIVQRLRDDIRAGRVSGPDIL